MSLITTIGAFSRPMGSAPTATTVFALSTDGQIRSGGGSYAAARTGAALLATTGGAALQVGQQNADAAECYIWESFFNFDLLGAGISAGATVSIADLSFYLQNKQVGGSEFTLEARTHNWGADLTTADWVAGVNLAAQTLLASRATSEMSNLNRYSLTENGTALRDAIATALAGDGILRIMLDSSRTVANQAPANFTDEYINLSPAEAVGTTQDPQLIVTWT